MLKINDTIYCCNAINSNRNEGEKRNWHIIRTIIIIFKTSKI